MRKIYEKIWFGIPFSSFAQVSAEHFPDKYFYSSFYQEFFKKYSSWLDLDAGWKQDKLKVAEFILSRPALHGRILSVGCGIGFIEKHLIESGVENFEIQETSDIPLRWIQKTIPDQSAHVGRFPECIPTDHHFNFIYLSTIDYCFGQAEWIQFLKGVKSKLFADGRCLIITPSFFSPSDLLARSIWRLKSAVKYILAVFKLRDLGQLWGWARTTEEFQNSMLEAGFSIRAEGILEDDAIAQKLYWLECS